MKALAFAVALALLVTQAADARDPAVREPSPGCGTFNYAREAIGPLDYRTIAPHRLKLVEDYHFTRKVETLRRGQSGTIGGDLKYTLNAIPNHPRALRATADYVRRHGPKATMELGMSTYCWFDRAISYRPDDALVRTVYATELMRDGKRDEARVQLDEAAWHAGDSATVHYNLGLLYLDLKDDARALEHARKAYALGAALPGLRNRLQQAGKWREANG